MSTAGVQSANTGASPRSPIRRLSRDWIPSSSPNGSHLMIPIRASFLSLLLQVAAPEHADLRVPAMRPRSDAGPEVNLPHFFPLLFESHDRVRRSRDLRRARLGEAPRQNRLNLLSIEHDRTSSGSSIPHEARAVPVESRQSR